MLERLLLPKTYSLLEPYSEERYAAGLRCRTLCYLNLDSIISFGSLKKRKRERKKKKTRGVKVARSRGVGHVFSRRNMEWHSDMSWIVNLWDL